MKRIALIATLLLFPLPALAGDAVYERGKTLVEKNCTKCHAVGETGDSPFKPAPPFREVALNYTFDELVDGFMEGLAVRHEAMPDWQMDMGQAEAITTYIMSLKKDGAELMDDSPEGQGFVLLRQNCAACHAISATGDSPFPKAPPFREVVKRYDPSNLQEALAEGIVTGHEGMPQFEFNPNEIAAIIAYLNSLKNG